MGKLAPKKRIPRGKNDVGRRGPTLGGVFLRYLFASAAAVVVLAVLWWLCISAFIHFGVVYRADAGARAWQQAQQQLPACTAESFNPSLIAPPLDYVLYTVDFSPQTDAGQTHAQRQRSPAAPVAGTSPFLPLAGSGAPQQVGSAAQPGLYPGAAYNGTPVSVQVLSTSLTQSQLARWLQGEMPASGWYSQFSGTVQLADGALCTGFYNYAASYVNPTLRRLLPDFQITGVLVLAATCLGTVALVTRHYARLLRRDTSLLASAAGRIASGDVSASLPTGARVREFRQALSTMDQLRSRLADSLEAQWAMEQQRREEVAALAHDLKTPLTIVGGNVELLAEEPLSESQRRYVDAMARGVENIRSYVSRLRVVSSGGAHASQAAPVPVGDVLARAAAQGQALCETCGVKFSVSATPQGVVQACEEDLLRVLANLMENAVRYAGAGGRVTLSATVRRGMVSFVVQDTGPGFSPQALAKGGKSFFTTDAARPQDGHQGMGLYFARMVALRCGGSLNLENPLGGGARVELCIPQTPSTEQTPG